MDFLKTASDFEKLASEMESKDLIDSLFSDSEEQTADGDVTSESKTEEGNIMNKTAGVEANKFNVSGINSPDQDEFKQVQGVVGFKDSEVKDAMKKVASAIRQLDDIKSTLTKEGTMTKYASLIESLESEIRTASEMVRKALKENPDSCLNMNKEPTKDKPYGAYDKSELAVNFETQSDHNDWKHDKHDEVGLGVPKAESEIPRIAAKRLAATKAVRIALNLLGDRCPQEVIAEQGRDFFAGMSMTAMDNTLRRIAETADLYEGGEADAAPAPAAQALTAPEATPAPVACATAAMPVTDDPKCDVKVEKVEEVSAPDFSEDEKKEIEKEASRIASERKAKIVQAANKRANELLSNPSDKTIMLNGAPEMAPAPEVAPEVAPEKEVATEADAEAFGLGDKAEVEEGNPELSKLFDDETEEQTEVTASRTASAPFAGKLPRASINANSSGNELESMWDTSDL